MSDEAPEFAEYSLVRLRSGACSIRARAYAETMHPGIGPAAEAEALYVRQTGLAERLRRHAGEFVVWDVGLGAAANALTVLRHAREFPGVRLLSFDNTDAPLRFAMEHADELAYFVGFREVVAELLRCRRAVVGGGGRAAVWELFIDDFPTLIQGGAAGGWPKPHLILYDPFSPAKNPSMWTLPLFERLYGLLDPDRPCVMPTYSRSTMLRVTLLLAGFRVGAGEASGLKEETTVAANDSGLIVRPLDRRWLERARRSDSAEPMTAPIHRKAPLTAGTWARLQRHAQFR